MKRIAIGLIVLATALTSTATRAAELIEVDTCGQVLPDGATGYLAADLDCSAAPLFAPIGALHGGGVVYLGRRGKLDLRGFTLTARRYGVVCDDICHDSRCLTGKCEVFGGTITGGNGWGISGNKVFAHDLTVTDSRYAIYAYSKLVLESSTLSGSDEYGVLSWQAKITGSTISDNGEFGIDGGKLQIKGSTFTNNGTSPDCADEPCGDIRASRRPRVKDTTCQRSCAGPGITLPCDDWNICTLD